MNPQLGICIHGVGVEYVQKHNYKRIQLCHKFSGAGDITSLLKMNRNHPIRISYHAPVFHQVDPTLTYYLNSNFRLREATFEILEINLKMAQSLPTDYVIIHFTSNSMNENITDYELKYLAQKSAERIDILSNQYNLPIYLEYTSYNERFNKPEDFVEVVKDYDSLGICLDIGHLYTICQTYGLDYFVELKKLLPYTKVMYLWNVTSKDGMKKYGYIPVHPSQKSEDGWIDIEKTLNMALSYNEDIYIIAEPNFEYKGEKYFEEGINWVNGIIDKNKSYKGEAL